MELENKYYQIYVDSIFDLASSIVLKFSDAATLMNQWVQGYTNGSYDENDPRTWKYYLNLSGEYFASDTPMMITSLDSLEEIVFSKQNLEFHRATKKAYAFGTTYYKELVDKYPDQEALIRGILYPCDIDTAIAAYDGQILAYPDTLVEATEPGLIPALQDHINGFIRRWHNVQYTNTDNLYFAGLLTVLYGSLPGAIENIRLRACLTYEAHSYHVLQYLASNSKLDKYVPYMTRAQQMYFYHNLAYIQNNNGREELFDALLQKTFTDRRLPMAHFSMAHSTENMPGDSLLPLVVFEKKPLNTVSNIDNKNQFSLNEVLDIEDIINPINHQYRDQEELHIEDIATYTLNPNVPTKLLQSTVIDYTDSEKFRMADIVLQHWLWLAHKGYYQAYVNFTIPANGIRLSLNPLDAFCFYAYAFVVGQGFQMDSLPMVVANRVERIGLAPLADLQAVVNPKRVSDQWLMTARATMPPVQPQISLEAFRNHCTDVFHAANEQWGMVCSEEYMTARGQKEAAICRLWGDEKFQLGDTPGQNYATWFADRNIVVKDLTPEQLLEVANVILQEATGANLTSTITMADIQRAMAGILTDLSSYSIQIGLSINAGPVIDAGFQQVRTDDLDIDTETTYGIEIPTVDEWNVKTQGTADLLLDMDVFPEIDVVGRSTTFEQPLAFKTCDISYSKDASFVIQRLLGVRARYNCLVDMTGVDNPRDLTIVPGMENFLKLPLDQQQASYVDTWSSLGVPAL
jgi:hypothetical protein